MKKFNNKISIIFVFLLLGLFPVQSLFSQWFFSLDVEQEYDSNPFRLIEPEEDYITQASIGLLKDWTSISAQYYGNYSLFNKNQVRNNYWQQLYLSAGDSTNFYVLYENRINKSEFNYYNYLFIKGGGNHTFLINKIIGRIGANLAYNIFQEIPEINNFHFSTYFSINRSFQTKTSLIGSVTYNYKYYNENEIKVTGEIDTTASLDKPMDLLSMSMVGNDLSNNPTVGGPGPGHGGGGHYDGQYYTNIESPSVSQLKISLRVAQSLAKYTGVAVQYYHSISLNGLNRNIIGLDYGYAKESEIFDDPIGYEGPTIGMEITQIAPYYIILKGAGYVLKKNYISQGVFLDAENYDGDNLRKDTYQTIWVSVKKSWELSYLADTRLSLLLYYQYVKNISNSYWYNYMAQSVSISLQLDL